MADVDNKVHEFKELDKFVMYTDAPGTEGKRSRLIWSSYRGNPRITVFTGVPNDSGKGVINAPMNPETFLILMNMIETMCKNPAEDKNKLACYTLMKSGDGQRSQERTLLSDIYFGRDASGIMWISVVAEGRPKIKFEFRISDFHKLFKGDGSQISESDASSLQAMGYIMGVRSTILPHMSELRPPYVPGVRTGGKPAPVALPDSSFEDLTF